MIEHPKIGEGVDTELAENMVFSMHPMPSPDGGDCLYMQDTWLVTADGGVPLSRLPMKIYVKGDRAPSSSARTASPAASGAPPHEYRAYHDARMGPPGRTTTGGCSRSSASRGFSRASPG